MELCDLGLVQCGATGPSVSTDSHTEALILFPDQRLSCRQPFCLVYYVQLWFALSVPFGAPCHQSCAGRWRLFYFPVALNHVVSDSCVLFRLSAGVYRERETLH